MREAHAGAQVEERRQGQDLRWIEREHGRVRLSEELALAERVLVGGESIERHREVHRTDVDPRVLEVEEAGHRAVSDKSVAKGEIAVRDLLRQRCIERGRELSRVLEDRPQFDATLAIKARFADG